MKKWKTLVKRILVLALTAAMMINTVDLTVLEVSAETESAEMAAEGEQALEETVSDNDAAENVNEPEQLTLEGEPGIALLADTATMTTKADVPYVYRSYDEETGKVTEQNAICGTAYVLSQNYVNDSVNANVNGYFELRGNDTPVCVVEGSVTIPGRFDIYRSVTLILADGATLQVDGDETLLGNSAKLTIYGQTNGTGKFIGKSINNTNNFAYEGNLEINGGYIEMKNDSCVAIGADQGRANIVINGGTVYAESSNGAAIGGSPSTYDTAHCFGSVAIHGGNVTAVSTDSSAAAIGSQWSDSFYTGSVSITGGTVTATQSYSGKKIKAIYAKDMNITNMMLLAYGEDADSAATAGVTYLNMEEALSSSYIKLDACSHTKQTKYVDGQQIKQGCLGCGAGETVLYTLGDFTLDGGSGTLTAERVYDGETRNKVAAVLRDADGNPVENGVTWAWYDNETVIDGAATSSYTTPLKLAAGEHVYRVEATVDGLTLTGDVMTVTVTKRPVGIDWGQTEFYYTTPETEYLIDPKPTNVVEGDDVQLQFDTTNEYYVNGSQYDRKLPADKRKTVGEYWNAVSRTLLGTDKGNYELEKKEPDDRLCKWSIKYFADAKAVLEGTQDAEGSYVGRVKLAAPEGMLLCVGGAVPENAVKFLYYSEVGSHSVSYYIVKEREEGDTAWYRTEDSVAEFTIAGDGSQSNTGVFSQIKDGHIVYFGTYDPDYTDDASYNGAPVAWRVLDADRTNVDTADGMFVISRDGLGLRHSGYYVDVDGNGNYEWRTAQKYSGGAFNGWCQDFLEGKYAQKLTSQECELLMATRKTKGDMNASFDAGNAESYGFDRADASNEGGAKFMYTNLQQRKLFLPSVEEVGLESETILAWSGSSFPTKTDGCFASAEDRAIGEKYWLRNWQESSKHSGTAAYDHSYNYAQINSDGSYRFTNTLGDEEAQMRPAANILFSKIWFLSAVGGKDNSGSDGTLAAFSVPEGNTEWKITMIDSIATQFEASGEKLENENKLTISYTNARTGENRYLSAVVEDVNGTITYYGRLKALTGDADKNGTATLVIPDNAEQGDSIYVYEEQFNGAYLVDSAGAPVLVHRVLNPEASAVATASTEDWTKDAVTITAPDGYTVCQAQDGNFTASFTVDSESSSAAGTTVSYYLKNTTTGTVSDEKSLVVRIDRSAPVFGENAGIRIKDSSWKQLQSNIDFGLCTKSADVTITAEDSLSGGLRYFYYVDTVTDKENYTALAADALEALSFTEAADGKFRLETEGNMVVYAYAVDRAGNRSAFICSDGVVVDHTSPKAELSAPSGVEELQDTSATAKLRVDEAATCYYVLSTTDIFADGSVESLAGLKSQQGCVAKSVTAEEAGVLLSLTFTGLSANTTYYLYAAAEDAAGNEGDVEGITFTTQKTKPYIETAPVLSGTYGETLKAMIQSGNAKVVTAEGSEIVLTGTWSVTDAAQEAVYPAYKDTQAYSLTFTPTGAGAEKYGTVDCEVVPQVAQKEITVGIQRVTRRYGDIDSAFGYIVSPDELAPCDTEKDLGIVLTTNANRMSSVGTYEISGSWNNENYRVSFMGLDSSDNWSIPGHGELVITRTVNTFVTLLSCADYTYNGNAPRPWAAAKFGVTEYLYAAKTGETEPEESAYSSTAPKSAGSYYVKAYVEETENYARITSVPVAFTISKAAAPVLAGDTVQVAYRKGRDAVVDIAGRLPENKGATSYAITGVEDADSLFGATAVDADGKLSYQVKSTADSAMNGKTAKLTVTATMENYADAEYTLTVVLTDRWTVELKSGSEVLCTGGNVLRYGAKLKDLSLNTTGADRAVFVKQDTETEVPGALAWELPDMVPAVGTIEAEWRFTPDDTAAYEGLTGHVSVVVIKETPTVTPPATDHVIYSPDRSILNVSLRVEGENGKATACVGGTEKEVSGYWVWNYDDPELVIPTVGNNGYEARFIPTGEDAASYEPAVVKVPVAVEKAKTAPNMPGNVRNVAYSCAKISDVPLTTDWVWQASDIDRILEVGVAVTATALYTGADKGNYEIENVEIAVTRSACEHAQTELRNKREATCTAEGSAGDTYCKVCGGLVEKGAVIAATGHSYTSAVTEQPTTTEEGVTTYTCGSCGHSYTESIAKLPGGQNDTNPGSASLPGTKKPFIKGADGKEGWEVIRGELDAVKEGETVTVDMNGSTTVPGNIFEQIRGRDVTLVLDMGDNITWSINGNDVEADKVKDINFGVTFGGKAGQTIPVEVINNVTGERYSINLTLAYDGEFGFKAVLTVNMEAKNAGLYANLFYYNGQSGELEFVCAGEIDAEGNVDLTFTHASDYTIVIDVQSMAKVEEEPTVPESPESTEEPSGTENPKEDIASQTDAEAKSASPLWFVLIGGVVVIAAAGIILFVKKKKDGMSLMTK